ncbi:Armadillo-type fold [Phytophthora cinnamomi]|uniref:Armadillo-type fold n=1 Tax=Phytophthora cinnamomi TaxID=4785 RepID=UPI00355A7B2B|nr:Armadillo-type fold [Phytophthora cinnamomi]
MSVADEEDNEPPSNRDSTNIGAGWMGDSNNASDLELTRAEAVIEAAHCGEFELAFRLCIVEDDLELLRRTMAVVRTPCMATLSNVARNALCTAFLSLLDGDASDEAENSSDIWLALQWLQRWAADIRPDRRQFDQLDVRVAEALKAKLREMATLASRSALAAAHVLFLLGE